MARCLVALGSNLGDRRDHLDKAVELLGFMPGVTLLGVSRYRETKPIGGPDGQAPFLNGACLVETDLSPQDLLGLLQAVEASLERERSVRWGPRTVDLDLLLHGETILESERLVLPHPRMATRRFVLEPSAEIAAELHHPTADCSVGDLLDNISQPDPYVAVTGIAGTATAVVAEAVADRLLARLVRTPTPPPDSPDPAAWSATLDAWSRPLAEHGTDDERADETHHGTVSDYWTGSLWLDPSNPLPPRAAICPAARPHVVLLLLADERKLQARAVRMQSRLVELLHGRVECGAHRPKAVVPIRGDSAERAIDEAVAAVEAMG